MKKLFYLAAFILLVSFTACTETTLDEKYTENTQAIDKDDVSYPGYDEDEDFGY